MRQRRSHRLGDGLRGPNAGSAIAITSGKMLSEAISGAVRLSRSKLRSPDQFISSTKSLMTANATGKRPAKQYQSRPRASHGRAEIASSRAPCQQW